MVSGLEKLEEYFLQIDVPPPAGPGHFAFFVPAPQAYFRWPHYPLAARPESGRAGGGRGLTKAACRASGLGEAIEIASCAAWPDEDLVTARVCDVGPNALLPDRLLGFSPAQLRDREAWNKAYEGVDWCPRPSSADAELGWCKADHAITGSEFLVPADCVLLGRRSSGDPDAVAVATTSGCAAGPTLQAARLSALLELIERDAIGRWWFGERQRATVDPTHLGLPEDLSSFIRERSRRTVLFDISTDLWSPVFAAASWEPDGSKVSLGFAAKLSDPEAACGAIVEMLQIELGIDQRIARDEADIQRWCDEVVASMPPLDAADMGIMAAATPDDFAGGSADSVLGRIIADCAHRGIDVFFLDRTRPEFEVPVVRAIAPGLCSDKPRWGWPRLLEPDPNDGAPVCRGLDAGPPNKVPLRV